MFVMRRINLVGPGRIGMMVPFVPPFVNDTFIQGSDAVLSSHVGETGATWTTHPLYSGTMNDDASLDRVYMSSAGAAAYYASGAPPGADYFVQADFYRLSALSTNFAIALGLDTSVDTMILLRLNDNGAGTVQWEVIDRVSAANTVRASTTTNIPTIGGPAVQAKLVRQGTAVRVFLDGVQVTALDATTTISATGRAGLRGSGLSTVSTGIHIDNFCAK